MAVGREYEGHNEAIFFVRTNYEKIIHDNLSTFFSQLSGDVEKSLGAEKKGDTYYFRAFGEDCRLSPEMLSLSGKPVYDPRGILISLYAVHASPAPLKLEPLRSFKDFPDSMPYHTAFSANSEKVLLTYVLMIMEQLKNIRRVYTGQDGPPDITGDFSFVLHPLPKIALCYIFYLPDDEFPASATCLFSANALTFMPPDGLADVAEYTSRGIIKLVRE